MSDTAHGPHQDGITLNDGAGETGDRAASSRAREHIHTSRRGAPASAPLLDDHLWTQAEASYFLGVSTRYLRESSCPKVLLPGARERQVVRYAPAVVRAWAEGRRTDRGRVA